MTDYDREAREQIVALRQEVDKQVFVLSKRIKELAAANEDLATTVAVLQQMLGEAGHLDETVFRYRVEAAVEEAREQRAIPRCHRCRQARPTHRMVMTQDGWSCDPSCEATR